MFVNNGYISVSSETDLSGNTSSGIISVNDGSDISERLVVVSSGRMLVLDDRSVDDVISSGRMLVLDDRSVDVVVSSGRVTDGNDPILNWLLVDFLNGM